MLEAETIQALFVAYADWEVAGISLDVRRRTNLHPE